MEEEKVNEKSYRRGLCSVCPKSKASYSKMGMEDGPTLVAMQISPANLHGGDSPPAPGKEQQAAGVGILLQIMMLVLSFVLGHVLRRHKFYYLPEASASLLIG